MIVVEIIGLVIAPLPLIPVIRVWVFNLPPLPWHR